MRSFLPPLPGRLALLPCLLLALAFAAVPADARPVRFDIPAQRASDALLAFSRQSGADVLFPQQALGEVRANAIAGEYEADVAIALLLRGTGFGATRDQGKYVVAADRKAEPAGRVTGQLVTIPRGEPIAGALVRIPGRDLVTLTEADGSFVLAGVPAGSHLLSISGAGIAPARITDVAVVAGQTTRLDALEVPVSGRDGSLEMKEVVVSASQLGRGDIRMAAVEVSERRVDGLINKGLIPTDLDSPLPYEVITRQEIEQLGATSIEEVFRYTPQITTYSTPNQEAAVSQIVGPNLLSSSLRMRGFDATQTTVLINGRRIARSQMGNLTGSSSGDLTRIPVSAIERIEILPQSGSAIYGGGAIGGVINVILRKNYSGTEVSTYVGGATRGGAEEFRGTILHGFSLNHGRTTGSLTLDYKHRGAVALTQRTALLDRAVQRLPFETLLQNFTTAPGLIRISGTTGDLGIPGAAGARYALIPAGTTAAQAAALTPASFAATAGQFKVTYDRFADNMIYTPTDTLSLHATLEHRLRSDRVTIYGDFTYSSSRQDIRNTRTYGTSTLLVPSFAATSPYNPFRTGVTPGFTGRAIYVNFLPLDLKSSGTIMQRDSWRLVAGAQGRIGERWEWTFDGTTEVTQIMGDSQVGGDNILLSSFFSSTTNPATYADRIALYNPFVDHRASPVAKETGDRYFDVTARQRYWQYVSNLLARVAGDVWTMPAGPLRASTGGELYFWQYEGGRPYVFTDDLTNLMGGRKNVASDIAYTKQSRTTSAVFAETTAPLLGRKWQPVPLASVELGLSARHEVTNDSKSATTFASALKVGVTRDLALRVSRTEGFYPPDQSALYTSDASSLVTTSTTTFVDPRRGNTNQTLPITSNQGPNPDLRPETSASTSWGAIFTPRFLTGARLSVDYWKIEKIDAIRAPTLDQLLANEAALPGRIIRGPNLAGDPAGWAGPVTQVDRRQINFATIGTNGIDAQLTLKRPTRAWGEFTLSGTATFTNEFVTQIAPGSARTEAVDTQTALKWRGRGSLLWRGGDWNAGLTARYTHSYLTDQTAPSPQYPAGTGIDGSRISSDLVWDLQVGRAVAYGSRVQGWRRLLNGTQWTLGVMNLFDRLPPWHSNGYYSRFSDPRLRYVYLQTKKSL